MTKIGLCTSCTHLKSCIFSKHQPVWQCEEFSNGNNVVRRIRQAKEKRVIREEVTESE